MSTCLQQLSQGLIELQLKKEMLFSGEKTTCQIILGLHMFIILSKAEVNALN